MTTTDPPLALSLRSQSDASLFDILAASANSGPFDEDSTSSRVTSAITHRSLAHRPAGGGSPLALAASGPPSQLGSARPSVVDVAKVILGNHTRGAAPRSGSTDSLNVDALLPTVTQENTWSPARKERPESEDGDTTEATEATDATDRLRHDFKLATSVINSQLLAEQHRRAALEAEVAACRAQATQLAFRAVESDTALERQTRAAANLKAKYSKLVKKFNHMTEELATIKSREDLFGPSPDLPPVEGLDTSNVPPEFFCPITCQMYIDPVVCTDGFTYEREAIRCWLLSSDSSPMTGARLASRLLLPNSTLRALIQDFKIQRGLGVELSPGLEEPAMEVVSGGAPSEELARLDAPPPPPTVVPARIRTRICALL